MKKYYQIRGTKWSRDNLINEYVMFESEFRYNNASDEERKNTSCFYSLEDFNKLSEDEQNSNLKFMSELIREHG